MSIAYKYPDAVLMVFCKAPIAGQVKTRLTAELSAEQAMQVHIELAERTLQLATHGCLCPVQLWCAPTTDHEFFAKSARSYPITLWQQQGVDLGARMHNAFCRAMNRYSRALIIGCDCPSLSNEDLEAAITALNPIAAIEHSKIPPTLRQGSPEQRRRTQGERDFGMLNKRAGVWKPFVLSMSKHERLPHASTRNSHCVLAPAEDGGYVLIGLNQSQPSLFDNMPWGTAQVLEQTRARIKHAQLRHQELKPQWDVDTPADLARYRALVHNNH